MSKAAIAAGADGLLIEIHPQPDRALSDSFQTLSHGEFKNLMTEMKSIAKVLGRGI
jgi:3-deoxy-7-phosphoheptulonate synthase